MTEDTLKKVEGQIVFIDHGTHGITIKDKTGQKHEMVWPATVKMENNKGEPLKQWWFISATAERSGDYWKLTSHTYYQKPADWPVSQHSSGGGSKYQPRNERLIAFLALHRDATEAAKQLSLSETRTYDDLMDGIYARAKRDVEQAMKDFPSV
jgi:hypothetical protein